MADLQKMMLQMQTTVQTSKLSAASPIAAGAGAGVSASSFFSAGSATFAGSGKGLGVVAEGKTESKGVDSKGVLLEEKKDTPEDWQARVKKEFGSSISYDSAIAIVKTAYAVRDGHSKAELDWQDVYKVCKAFEVFGEVFGDDPFSAFCKPDLVKKVCQYYQAFRVGEEEAMRAIY